MALQQRQQASNTAAQGGAETTRAGTIDEAWAFDAVCLVLRDHHASSPKEVTVSIKADLLGFVVERRMLPLHGTAWTERSFAVSLADAINEVGRITHEHLREGYAVDKGLRL